MGLASTNIDLDDILCEGNLHMEAVTDDLGDGSPREHDGLLARIDRIDAGASRDESDDEEDAECDELADDGGRRPGLLIDRHCFPLVDFGSCCEHGFNNRRIRQRNQRGKT